MYMIVLLLCCLTRRDNEDAYVSVNGNVCWIKNDLRGTDGTQLCGGWFKEERFRVTGCYITLSAALEATVPLTVRVWTNLDGDADDESFGIDNVVVAKIEDGYLEGSKIGNLGGRGPHSISPRTYM